MTTLREIARILLDLKNVNTTAVRSGELKQKIGPDGYQEALTKRWIEPDSDMVDVQLTSNLNKIQEMRRAIDTDEVPQVAKPSIARDFNTVSCESYSNSLQSKLMEAETSIPVGKISFSALKTAALPNLGMVVMGAGGDPTEWIDGISDALQKAGIVDPSVPTFVKADMLTGNVAGEQGRKDLLLVFNKAAKVNVGKLAMWRLQFGDISWVDDFVANYAKDYKANAEESYGKIQLDKKPGILHLFDDLQTQPATTLSLDQKNPKPADPNVAEIGDEVYVAENGKTYKAVVQAKGADGKYTLSFGTEKPSTQRSWEPKEMRIDKKAEKVIKQPQQTGFVV
jgi:hypothetical protein